MPTVLTAPAQAGKGTLTPAELNLHFLNQDINHKRMMVENKLVGLVRPNIRKDEIVLLVEDIRILNAEILDLEGQAKNAQALI